MIWYILGTRPEFIKAWPVVRQLHVEQRPVRVISTGQHTSLAEGMPLSADVTLGVGGCDDPYLSVTRMAEALQDYAEQNPKPRWIVVQGDTCSALAGARLAESLEVPLCHLEAGLRSGHLDDPWPEEGFRVEIDRRAALKCCPTEGNLANLAREGLQEGSYVTGNPITDALRLMGVSKRHGRHVLITLHRRESFGPDLRACTERVFQLARSHPDTPFLWPLHPNPHVTEALRGFPVPSNLSLVSPMPYMAFLAALADSTLIITDSGGLVEECTTLGIPCLIARDHTERPEALGGLASSSVLIGRDGVHLAELFDPIIPTVPLGTFGDGHCAPRITRLLT